MDSVLRGIPASPGIVVGPVHLLRWEVPEVKQRLVLDSEIETEIERLHQAFERARERLRHLRVRAEAQAGPEEAAIFDVQLTILDDRELTNSTEALIRQNLGAEKAFDLVLLEWRQHFARHTAPMLRERVGDLTDVHIRVLSILMDLPDHDPVDVPRGANAILVTHDLTPSLTLQLDRECIAGIATDAGTATAHVAILARSLGLPAVVGLRNAVAYLRGGELAILDGAEGTLLITPSDTEVTDARDRVAAEAGRADEIRALAFSEPVTRDNTRVVVRANVDIPDESELAANSGADGVGLMRTEFLVVGRATMPDEDEQYRAYRRVVEAFRGHPVIIRTFDVGGDKLPVGGFPSEANPFLGWRAIRMCLDEADLFKVQLRALLRAAVHGDLRIMLPLVVTVDEVRETRQLLEEAVQELSARRVPFRDEVPLGVMVETPAAAVACDTLVRDVDFFSIGSNDLVQYTLAVDRGNANMAHRFTPLHPAVLRLIKQVQVTGAAHGVDVGVCGEMASQPLSVFALLGLGIRHLSVSPRAVPYVKRVLRGVRASAAQDAADAALSSGTAREVELILRRRLRAELGDDGAVWAGLPVSLHSELVYAHVSAVFLHREQRVADRHLFTSESVTEGHPDKIADQISDAVLDAILAEDSSARVACETLVTTGLVVIAGEITTEAYVHLPDIVRATIAGIGYNDASFGFDSKTCAVMSTIDRQSPDISQGVDTGGAGDQGMMFGYATDETPELMPLPIQLAHRLTHALAARRKDGTLPWLRPDGKAQVSVVYEGDRPVAVDTVVVSTQHDEKVSNTRLRRAIISDIIEATIPEDFRTKRVKYHINPTGRFVIGGPQGDAGLTGRKIIVDTYGGMGRHGGGAFSGKDPSKVDRSACYAARWVAKNIVAAKLARRCEVQVAYAIGVAEPVSVFVQTFGTGIVPDRDIEQAVSAVFDLTPRGITRDLDLRKPIYQATAAYGHFGRQPETVGRGRNKRTLFTWERTDRAVALKREVRG